MLPSDGGNGGLYLSAVPVPTGDPAALSHAAATYTAAQGEISRNHATLTSAASQATGTAWQGTGAAGYRTAVLDLTALYARTSAALASGATALRAYAADLTTAQDTARRANAAVATANAAATAMLAAQATADQSRAAAQDAADTSLQADLFATAAPHSAQAHLAAANARSAAADAQTTAASDASRLSSLSAIYQSDRSNAVRLCSVAQQQASHAATKAGAAFRAAATGLAGKSVTPARGDAPGVWESSEPFRKVLEFVLAPLDIADADHWIDWLEKAAGVPASWLKGVDKQLGLIEELQKDGKPAGDALIDGAKLLERAGNNWDAWDAFAPGWLKASASNLGEIRGAGNTLGGLGLVADAGTMISPQDPGVMGWADRGVAGFNGGLIAANIAMDELPIVGQVLMAGTGVYLASDFLYHHWTPFHNAANAVGHATVKAVDEAGHEASSVWSTVSGWS